MSEWIPVSERLPENDQQVLVTVWYKNQDGQGTRVEIGRRYEFLGNFTWRYPSLLGSDSVAVIAWMPLPKPYEGNEE